MQKENILWFAGDYEIVTVVIILPQDGRWKVQVQMFPLCLGSRAS